MKRLLAKILLFFIFTSVIISCNAVKRLEGDQKLLVKNEIFSNGEEVKDSRIYNQLYQEPNIRFLGIPFQLHYYNLARPDIDSILTVNYLENDSKKKFLTNLLSKKQFESYVHSRKEFNNWLKRTGEAPVIVSDQETKKSVNKLKSWYWNNGWFNVEADYEIIPLEKEKRARVEYYVTPHQPYFVDSVKTDISAVALDSIYKVYESGSKITSGSQYNTLDFNAERDRLSELFRNNGVYNFDQEYISFDADTVETSHNLNTTLIIQNRRNNVGDSISRVPFKVHKISKVNIITDYTYENRNKTIQDSATFEGYNLYSFNEKMDFKPEAVSDAIFIKPGTIYRDLDRTRTYNRISSLRVFKYPNIQYSLDPEDSTETDLISNIFLSTLPKYSLGFDFDLSQSNIQNFGIGFGGSLLIRNVFGGAENFEITGRGSIGSSKDAAKSGAEDRFFDISEIGADVKLSFPRIFFPLKTEKFIPKYTSPFTEMSLGISTQRNIGLDKQTFTGILNYNWKPSQLLFNSLDLLNIQYVRNLNVANYFNVYQNSYEELNEIARRTSFVFNDPSMEPTLEIPNETDRFINSINNGEVTNIGQDDLLNFSDIVERKNRLTENNLIFASNYTYLWNTKENLYDSEFTRFRFKIETAGNILAALSKIGNFDKNEAGNYKIFGVPFSQYIKTEIDFIKHWDLGGDNVFATRAFGGIAIPYGNANSIPITKTFFAGGPNDNRAWQAYDLGPGSSGSLFEFNEANMKLAFNGEYRFGLLNDVKGALFVDVGNIWNVLDNFDDVEAYSFSGISDLKELAVGSGFGIRYDFNFFVLRFDIGFKTYDPARVEGNRWFKDYNFNNAVYNVGINYPF